jgi:murein DD-endopeptidase MepM/ murein hydrolase activator NlpD
MFFRTATALTLSLAIIGIPQIGFANDQNLVIEQEDLFSDELKAYYRSFTVTSVYYPPKKQASIIVPEITWPTNSKIIVSGYGYRNSSCSKCSSNHKGVDFTPGLGTPVYAAIDGIISKVEYSGGFGMHIYIEHIVVINNKSERWQTVYAHLQKNSVPEKISVGSIVEAGTIIGAVGNTGTSTGPHLHFEILVEGENVDPEKYLLMYANE